MQPMWMYGVQLWGCAINSCTERVQVFQNKVLRHIVDAQWLTRNKNIHRDLDLTFVKNEITRTARRHQLKLASHANIKAQQFLTTDALWRHLKRKEQYELVRNQS